MTSENIVSVPIEPGGLIKLEALRDLLEAVDHLPEHHRAEVVDGEIRVVTS